MPLIQCGFKLSHLCFSQDDLLKAINNIVNNYTCIINAVHFNIILASVVNFYYLK